LSFDCGLRQLPPHTSHDTIFLITTSAPSQNPRHECARVARRTVLRLWKALSRGPRQRATGRRFPGSPASSARTAIQNP
jgi:hypothetical protein